MSPSFLFLIIFPLFVVGKLSGQVYLTHSSIDGIGWGAYAKATNLFAPISNPASLLNEKVPGIEIYGERHLRIKEISRFALSSQTPLPGGVAGISILQFNSPHFKETQLALRYGLNLGKCEIGIALRYMRIGMVGYGSDAAFSYEVGTLLKLSPAVNAGIVISNPSQHGFAQTREKLPFTYAFGVGYNPGKAVCVEVELRKDQHRSSDVSANIIYRFDDSFHAALGSLLLSNALFVSAGWKKKQFRVSIAVRYHQQLSYIPGLTFQYLKSPPDEM